MSDQEKMRWYAGRGKHFASNDGYYFARLDDGTLIEIHPERHDEQFQRYLDHLGVKPTNWSTIMKKAEEEWRAYCRLMDQFAEDPQQWLDERGRDVFVEYPQGESNNQGGKQ